MDVREATKKMLLGFLAITLVIPALLFARPEKAEALVSLAQCFSAKAVTTGIGTTANAVNAVISVGTNSAGGNIINTQGAGSAASNEWSACFMKSLTKIIAKTLLHTFTQSIVNWINTGFEGSPSFITNPEGFFSDVADQTIGKIIQDISPLLCAPFKLNIKFALGLNMSLRTRETVTCRLSDVIANVQGAYDSFVSGTVGSGNLSRWVHIAGTQSNNPYGAYIGATSIMSASITTATGQQIKLLDWGKGFKSWRSCEKWGPDIKGANNKVIRKGPCIKEGPIKTPGSIIEGQTTGALATTFHELELASEIDEVVGALINQLLVKAMTGVGGLLGASKGSITDSGQSATDALFTDPTKGVGAVDAKTPEGIDCHLRYYPATVEKPEKSGFYEPDDSIPAPPNWTSMQVWTDNLGVGKTAGVVKGDTSPFVPAMYRKVGVADLVPVTRDGFTTWNAYFAAVKAGCANAWNKLIDDAAAGGRGVLGDGTPVTPGAGAPPPPQPQSSEGNISTGKFATQSQGECGMPAVRSVDSFPQQAVDGNPSSGSIHYGTFSCTKAGTSEWWEVDLETERVTKKREWIVNEIREINIYRLSGDWARGDATQSEYRNSLRDGNVEVTLVADSGTPLVLYRGRVLESVFKVPLPAPTVKGRFLRISQTGDPASMTLAIAEVEVIGKATRLDTSGNTPTQVVPFSFTVSPAQKTMSQPRDWTARSTALTIGYEGDTFTWDNISFLPNKAQDKVSFLARYFRCTQQFTACNDIEGTKTPYDKTPTDFFSNFSSLTFTYAIDGTSKAETMIEFDAEKGIDYTADARALNATLNATPAEPLAELLFAEDLVLRNTRPIQLMVKGTPTTNLPFKIVINAVTDAGTATEKVVGTTTAEFTVQ
ncbi:MAG: hypothetical protein UY50_C0023G0026 [Parcubacteria group bacterium GW2011_GWA2_49_9]|nr:MAG: hypothetical protein UY50_C0023G0026 [Parcubacteria group bacterium GW2011_GWA2_49_9]